MLHSPITADAATYAVKLLAGEKPDTRADGAADWLAAARYAFDGDCHDLEYLMDRAASYDDFEAWAERCDPAGNYSFDDWFHGDAYTPPSFGMQHPDSPSFGGAR